MGEQGRRLENRAGIGGNMTLTPFRGQFPVADRSRHASLSSESLQNPLPVAWQILFAVLLVFYSTPVCERHQAALMSPT